MLQYVDGYPVAVHENQRRALAYRKEDLAGRGRTASRGVRRE
jgi:hypothetical protein